MSESELEKVLRIYYPIIKLEKGTYMIGLEQHVIIPKNDRLVIKTLVGEIELNVKVALDCIDDSLVLAKTINELVKPFKQVV